MQKLYKTLPKSQKAPKDHPKAAGFAPINNLRWISFYKSNT